MVKSASTAQIHFKACGINNGGSYVIDIARVLKNKTSCMGHLSE